MIKTSLKYPVLSVFILFFGYSYLLSNAVMSSFSVAEDSFSFTDTERVCDTFGGLEFDIQNSQVFPPATHKAELVADMEVIESEEDETPTILNEFNVNNDFLLFISKLDIGNYLISIQKDLSTCKFYTYAFPQKLFILFQDYRI